jgi:hypothetical protein
MASQLVLRIAALLPVIASGAYAGSIEFTGTPFSDRVVLNVKIIDEGGAPDCDNFWITRGGLFDFKYLIPRTPGTSTYEFVDTSVQPNTQYVYDLRGYHAYFLPSDQNAFENAFGDSWHGGFRVFTNWGPAPIGKGQLVTEAGDVWSAGLGFVFGCSANLNLAWGVQVPDEARHYIGTGETVFVRGHWFRVSQQHGDGIIAEEVLPDNCPTSAVEASTWSRVKQVYRDPKP